jgi:hypothetical protein
MNPTLLLLSLILLISACSKNNRQEEPTIPPKREQVGWTDLTEGTSTLRVNVESLPVSERYKTKYYLSFEDLSAHDQLNIFITNNHNKVDYSEVTNYEVYFDQILYKNEETHKIYYQLTDPSIKVSLNADQPVLRLPIQELLKYRQQYMQSIISGNETENISEKVYLVIFLLNQEMAQNQVISIEVISTSTVKKQN